MKFKETKMAIPDCRDKSAIKTFIKEPPKESKLYKSLKLIKPWSFKDVLERAEDVMEYKKSFNPET